MSCSPIRGGRQAGDEPRGACLSGEGIPILCFHNAIARARSMGVIRGFLVNERQPVALEILEPFIPSDRPEVATPRHVEANGGATVVHVDGSRSGSGHVRRRRFRPMARRPAFDRNAIVCRDGSVPSAVALWRFTGGRPDSPRHALGRATRVPIVGRRNA